MVYFSSSFAAIVNPLAGESRGDSTEQGAETSPGK